jgi:hypothetical protein
MSDFLKATRQIKKKEFLMIGQRWDIGLKEPLDFQQSGWEDSLKNRVVKEGKLHGISGIDYFIFPKGIYTNLPPLAVGRPGWDNWLIYHTRSRKIPVIDATSAIMIVHQDHGHTDFRGGEKGFWEGPEAKLNVQLGGGPDNSFTMEYATALLTPSGLKKALTPRHIYYRLHSVLVIHKRLGFLLTVFKIFEKCFSVIKGSTGRKNN